MRSLVFVIDTLNKGGAESVLLQYAEALHSYYKIKVVVLKKINNFELIDNVQYYFVLNKEQKLAENIFLILQVLSDVIKESDIAIGFSDYFVNYVTVLAAKLTGKPVILSVRNLLSCELNKFEFVNINKDLVSLSYKKADGIVCVSNDCKKDLVASFKLPEQNIKVLKNPVDIRKFKKKVELSEDVSEIFSGCPVILAIGRLVKQKNYPFLIKVFSQIRQDAILCIVGTGEEHDVLMEYVCTIGLEKRVFFLGRRDDIPALLQHSALLFMASLYEGQPNVVLEAMAAGTLVVAPEIPAVTELIESGYNGLLYKSGDEEEAGKQLGVVLSERSRFIGMIQNAKRTVMSHDINLAADALADIIDSVTQVN